MRRRRRGRRGKRGRSSNQRIRRTYQQLVLADALLDRIVAERGQEVLLLAAVLLAERVVHRRLYLRINSRSTDGFT